MVDEGPRKREHLFLRKGVRVTLRTDLSGEDLAAVTNDFAPGVTYRVFHIERHGNGGPDSVWLGPGNASEADIKAFNPSTLDPDELHQRYPNVTPIRIDFLKKS